MQKRSVSIGREFRVVGPATEKARRDDVHRNSVDSTVTASPADDWQLLAERRCCLDEVAETGTQ